MSNESNETLREYLAPSLLHTSLDTIHYRVSRMLTKETRFHVDAVEIILDHLIASGVAVYIKEEEKRREAADNATVEMDDDEHVDRKKPLLNYDGFQFDGCDATPPSEADLTQLEALYYAFAADMFEDAGNALGTKRHEFFAILALRKINAAFARLKRDAESGAVSIDKLRTVDVSLAMVDALEAQDAVGAAELALVDDVQRSRASQKATSVDDEVNRRLRERAVRSANTRHEKGRKARVFVVSEWQKNRGAYDDNKSAFARDYVRRVYNEFDVKITEKQMRDFWLADQVD